MSEDETTRIRRIADAMYARHRELAGVPTMAAAVVERGTPIAFVGHAASQDSLFRIASMTKSFTAAAILILRDEGRLRLDGTVAEYAPEYAGLRGPTSDAPPITVRHLLSMASGLATDDPWGDRHLDWTDAEHDAAVQATPLFAVGTQTAFEYSNLGYGIAGRIAERVSGQRLQRFVTERLLQPLGMHHTVWQVSDAPAGAEAIVGVRADGVTPERTPGDGALAAMAGLWSTVADLAKWIDFFADAWPPRDGPDHGPLRRSSRREMQVVQTSFPPQAVTSVDGAKWLAQGGYGLGLHTHYDERLGEIVGHSGGLPGYGSNMSWVKGTRLGTVALGGKTYTSMAQANRRMLMALAAANLVRRPALPVPQHLIDAGNALFALLRDWDNAHAERLFADNVAPDLPFELRRRDAAELMARHGGLTLARIEATSNASGRVVMHSATGQLEVSFSLAPNWRIQKYDLPLAHDWRWV